MAIGPTATGHDQLTVSGTSAMFATTLVAGVQYILISETRAWIKIGAATPTAVANADDNIMVAPDVPYPISLDPSDTGSNRVAIIQDSAGGEACLFKLHV